jgi:hypothetical protein
MGKIGDKTTVTNRYFMIKKLLMMHKDNIPMIKVIKVHKIHKIRFIVAYDIIRSTFLHRYLYIIIFFNVIKILQLL